MESRALRVPISQQALPHSASALAAMGSRLCRRQQTKFFYSFNSMDTLEVISGAVTDTQQASCWISLDRSDRYAYVSNTGSGTISSYQIGGAGDLTLMNAIAARTGGAPIHSLRDSKFIMLWTQQWGEL